MSHEKQESILTYPNFQILADFVILLLVRGSSYFAVKNSRSVFISELAGRRVRWVSSSVLLTDPLTRRPGWCSCQTVTAAFLAMLSGGILLSSELLCVLCGPLPNKTAIFVVLA